MRYCSNNFQKSPSAESFSLPHHCLTLNFGNLKFRDLPKLCFFRLIMTKLNFKKSVMTSLLLLRHRKTSPN